MPKKKGNKSSLCKAMNEKRWAKNKSKLDLPASKPSVASDKNKNIRQCKLEEQSKENQHYDDYCIEKCSNYVLVDVFQLKKLVQCFACPQCMNRSLDLELHCPNGYAAKMSVQCGMCEEISSSVYTSKRLEPVGAGTLGPFDVNKRITQAFIHIGKGHSALEQFSMVMNMNCLSNNVFYDHANSLQVATSGMVYTVLEEARCEVRKAYSDLAGGEITSPLNISVSYDGSWLTRGHTSQYGVGCVIDLLTGYVIDFEVMSKYCQKCKISEKELGKSSPEFQFWYEGHASECDINHLGSSGAIEMEAAVQLWQRSEKFDLRYTTMLSDGDTKTHGRLTEVQPYGPNVKIQKEECVNHVGKRLNTALRSLRNKMGSEGVRLGGKGYGTLKDATITKLQRYYDKAIRQNIGEMEKMKTAIYATLLHSISTDKRPQHSKCPTGKDSWCFYQRAVSENQPSPPHYGNVGTPLREDYLAKIMPVYQRLASDSLLSRCLLGKTQNANESLHSMIWRKCPKTIFVSKGRIEYAVGQAICEYNVGCKKTLIETQKCAGMSPGNKSKEIAHNRLQRRVKNANLRQCAVIKRARHTIKLAKIKAQEAARRREGETYKAGSF